METTYSIEGVEYTLSQSASGDWCVSVDKYGKETEYYCIGSKEDALIFILSEYECKE